MSERSTKVRRKSWKLLTGLRSWDEKWDSQGEAENREFTFWMKSRTGKQWKREDCRQQMATMSSRRSSGHTCDGGAAAALQVQVKSRLFKGLEFHILSNKNKTKKIHNSHTFFGTISNHLNALNSLWPLGPLGVASLINAKGWGALYWSSMNNGSAVAELYRWQNYHSHERETCYVLSDGRRSSGGLTFTWILMGRGIPSFRSLVLSLKSLQNWPMGIPLWVGDKCAHTHTQTTGWNDGWSF